MLAPIKASRRDSRAIEGLICPRCGRSLFPVPKAGSLDFYCNAGDAWSLQELLRSPSGVVRGGLRTMLAEWRRTADRLRASVSEALLTGYPSLAGIFWGEVETLEGRIEFLERALRADPRSAPGPRAGLFADTA